VVSSDVVVSPAPAPLPVEMASSVPLPDQVPVSAPFVEPQLMEQDSVASSSSPGEAQMMMPEAMTPYVYHMMAPPPYYTPAYVPVPCYGYVPFFYGPSGAVQAPHEVVKPVAVHSKPPLDFNNLGNTQPKVDNTQPKVDDIYTMSELSLKGDSNANGGGPVSPLPPKPIGRPDRQSAFHGRGSPGGLIPAVK
jgi:hypothetical protein